jgi:predicted DNA-binding protein
MKGARMENDPAEIVASLLGREPDEEPDLGVYAMTLRLPVSVAAQLMALAEQTGRSRNEMASYVIRAGFNAVSSLLEAEALHNWNERTQEVIESFVE